MASIYRHGGGWRVQVHVKGERDSAVFRTRQEAAVWALEREALLGGRKVVPRTVRDALRRYGREVSPTHKGERWEVVRLEAMERGPLADRQLASLEGTDLAAWRDARLQEVAPASVAREMALLRSVFESCRLDWGWLKANPMADVRKPRTPASRKRRISAHEVDCLTLAFGLGDGLRSDTATQRTGLAFLFALETAMRAGEIVGLRPEDVGAKSVRLPVTKNGDARAVPLSPRAREILAALPPGLDPVFGLDDATRDALWRKARDKTGIENLRFHDSRAEAIWRLSKKLDVLELARVIGHRDLRSLMIYYEASADDMADRL